MTGLEALRARARSLPDALLESAAQPPPFDAAALDRIAGARAVVATGIGSSRAHAEFFADCLATEAGWPARFATTGELAGDPPAVSEHDLLVVFSQGLSPNARFALATPERWAAVVLVTAERSEAAGEPAAQGPPPPPSKLEKGAWLQRLAERGVVIVSLPSAGEDEFGTLVRLTGPVLAFARALDMAKALAELRGRNSAALEWQPESVVAALRAVAQRDGDPLAELDARRLRSDPIAIVGAQGSLRNARHAATRLSESLWIPAPGCWDELEFAHGPLQALYERPATVLFVGRSGAPDDAEAVQRLRATLSPERHRVIEWQATLEGRAAVFEYEALAIEFTLRAIEASGLDPAEWPAKGADGPLYERSPRIPEPRPPSTAGRRPLLAHATHPEIAALLASGRRLAVVPLGSTEQHGAHLPFATDTWIADAVAERLCARRDDAIALPALPFGCASEHMAFEGTLDLREETLAAVLGDLVASLARHGFAGALVFSAHGGNAAALASMQRALEARAAPMPLVVHADLERLTRRMHEASAAEGVEAAAAGHHAGEGETSVLLSLAPGAVRRAHFREGRHAVPGEDVQSLFYPSLRERAPGGVVGDPRGASALRAERYLDAWVRELDRTLEDGLAR